MNYDRSERIRRAAILIASLEQALAEQMLESLPPAEATKILAEVDRLGELDSEELQDVLDEFRAAGRQGRTAQEAVEFTYSVPQPVLRREPPAAAATIVVNDNPHSQANAEQDADAELMAELLSQEHPQTIAAALSRLGSEQGAAVFAGLPAPLQADVLDRLATLEPADEDAVQDVESQLQHHVELHRERRQRAVASAELARRMLQKTSPDQRDRLLARLSPPGGQRNAAAAEIAPTNDHMASQQAHALATQVRMERETAQAQNSAPPTRFEAWTDEPSASVGTAPAAATLVLEDRSRELELINDRSLLDALRVADERTVQWALAASSEKFLNRVASKLPRRQATRLREMVRSIGPTRLTDLRAAQHELLRLARGAGASETATR
jgi:flagellar motor switch protein FliG